MQTMERLRAELRAQDEALAAAKDRLAEMGELGVSISPSFFGELEELAVIRRESVQTPRSAIRA